MDGEPVTDPYDGRDTRDRSNSPIGFFRVEYVMCVSANELVLSGSPIEYFTHQDYRGGWAQRVAGGGSFKWGVERIYNITQVTDVDPADMTAISTDGYSITLTPGEVAVGDLCRIFYYSAYTGTMDHQTAAQTGDGLNAAFINDCIDKVNDVPPLAFSKVGMEFDIEFAYNSGAPGDGSYSTLLSYTGVTGTWQGSGHEPFYPTCLMFSWSGGAAEDLAHNYEGFYARITIDSGTPFEIEQRDFQMCLTNWSDATTYDNQFTFINLGLIECESDLEVEVKYTNTTEFEPDNWLTTLSAWYIP